MPSLHVLWDDRADALDINTEAERHDAATVQILLYLRDNT